MFGIHPCLYDQAKQGNQSRWRKEIGSKHRTTDSHKSFLGGCSSPGVNLPSGASGRPTSHSTQHGNSDLFMTRFSHLLPVHNTGLWPLTLLAVVYKRESPKGSSANCCYIPFIIVWCGALQLSKWWVILLCSPRTFTSLCCVKLWRLMGNIIQTAGG